MLRSARVVLGFACLVLAPSLAFGQATITGVVKDASGAVLRRDRRSASPVLIEKVRRRRPMAPGSTESSISVPALHRDLHVDRVQHGQARRHRADRRVDRDHQRRPEGRRRRGNDHGHRRNADRRRAERPAADDAQQRDADDGADRAVVGGDGRARSRHRHPGGRQRGHQVTPQMTVFGGTGGRGTKGACRWMVSTPARR